LRRAFRQRFGSAALLVVHIAAALWHAVQRDGIFLRMWPGIRRATRWQSDSGVTQSRGDA
jgi:hypothetical protein